MKVNNNFHNIYGKSLFEIKNDEKYIEYRKKWNNNPKNMIVEKFPLGLDIEISSACNLKCEFCFATYDKSFKRGNMSFELYKKIIDEGSEKGLYTIKFNFRGEPLLNKDIFKMIRYAKEKGIIDIYFNTNAMLLTKEVSKKLIESGLDRISISMDGYTKEVYEKYRVDADFNIVLENIKTLNRLKKEYNSNTPFIRIQTVLLPEFQNQEFQKNYVEFWKDYADEIAYLDYLDFVKHSNAEINENVNWQCEQLYQRMCITFDGEVYPCNKQHDCSYGLGNINQNSLEELWHCDRINDMREKHKKGDGYKLKVCRNCEFMKLEVNKLRK